MSRMPQPRLGCLVALVLAAGSALAQTQDSTLTFTYDAMGNVKLTSRPLGRSTAFVYDALGRQTQHSVSIAAGTLVTKFGYDGASQVAAVTDPRNLITSYAIDGIGNTSGLSSPDTSLTSYTQDEAGNIRTLTNARGKTTSFLRDALGRLTQAQYQSGVPSRFEYDGGPGGPVAEIGNLTRIDDESGSTSFTHDLQGRVLTKSQIVNVGGASAQFTVGYSYGSAGPAMGKLERITYPSGARVSYRYNGAGRVDSVTLMPAAGASVTAFEEIVLLSGISYTPTGEVGSWNWGNASLPSHNRVYDLDGRLASYPTDLAGTIRTVSYNAAGLIAGYSHAGGPNPTAFDQTFTYDLADRLTSFSLGGAISSLTYDGNGNRTGQTGPGVTYSYSGTSNQLSTATFATPRIYSYDAAGNRVGDGLYSFIYSDRGRLAHVAGAAVLDFYYNALDQRVLKAGTAGRTYYVFDETQRPIGEYGPGQQTRVETVYLGNLPVAVLTDRGFFYSLNDHLNAPLVLAQPDGTTVWDWRMHDPFGNNAPVASEIMPAYDHRFPGQVADSESGLFYNYYRDYDPQIGRYVQSDPIGLGGGVNTYNYVGGNPLTFIDPFGLDSMCMSACKAAGGAIGGAGGYYAGGAVGGLVGGAFGGAAGTLAAPGVGTIGLGGTGAAIGATIGSTTGSAGGMIVGSAVGSAIGQAVCEEQDCKPAVGTQCYTGPDTTHGHGGLNNHYHIFQMFKFNGKCQWKYLGGKVGKGVLETPTAGMAACSSYPGFTGR